MIFFAANKKDFDGFKRLFIFKKSGILKPLLLGAAIYTVIILGYFSTRKIIDFSNVTSNLTEGMGITANRFIYVSLYISLMNSFLEEFFFRGYGFKKVYNQKIRLCIQLVDICGISRRYVGWNVQHRRVVLAAVGADGRRMYF